MTGRLEPISTPPRRVPRVGVVLRLDPRQWLYNLDDRPIAIRVTQVRADISLWYGGDWVWVMADELDARGQVVGEIGVLVWCDAIPDADTDRIPGRP